MKPTNRMVADGLNGATIMRRGAPGVVSVDLQHKLNKVESAMTGAAAESSQPEFMTPVKSKPVSSVFQKRCLSKEEESRRTVLLNSDGTHMRNDQNYQDRNFRHDSMRDKNMLTPSSKQTVMQLNQFLS